MKTGDKVSLLDDDLSGTIKAINGDMVTIETEDGFNMDFPKRELVVIQDSGLLRKSVPHDLNEILKEKDIPQKKSSTKVKTKDRTSPSMVVDLHIHKLTSSEKGMSAFDKLNLQLDTARHKLEFAIKKRMQKIVFIHGVGEGVLKAELETLLRRYDEVKFYDADFKTYGFGATEIYIYQNI